MNHRLTSKGDALAEEIARYLAAVEVFRALGCEPSWLAEPGPGPNSATSEPQTTTVTTVH